MKKSDMPKKDREMAERMDLCPFCWNPLRNGECDRWACWVTRVPSQPHPKCTSEKP